MRAALPPTISPVLPARRLVAAALLSLGLLAASFAYSGLVIRRIVTDEDVATTAATAALDDGRVQQLLIDRTSAAIGSQLLGPDTVASLQAVGYDPAADLDAIARSVVADPQFRSAFVETVLSLHRVVLVETGPVPVVDITPLVSIARDAAVERNSAYAGLFPTTGTLRVSLPSDGLPDLTGVSSAVESRARMAAGLAVLLVAAAVAAHHRRPQVVRRVGIWAIGVAMTQGVVAAVLPVAARRFPGDLAPVAGAVAHTLQPRLLAPAAIVAATGVALVISAWRWQRSIDSHHERVGASAFLDHEADDRMIYDGTIELATHRSPMGAPPVSLVTAGGMVSPRGDAVPTTPRGA